LHVDWNVVEAVNNSSTEGNVTGFKT
jgi:hypothetical protein